jgi:hypothetical protein
MAQLIGCSVDQSLGCSVAQLVVRWPPQYCSYYTIIISSNLDKKQYNWDEKDCNQLAVYDKYDISFRPLWRRAIHDDNFTNMFFLYLR